MKDEMLLGTAGTITSAVGTATQTNQTLQTISLIITIIGAIITYLVIPLISWYTKSKKDGKITPEEIKEGLDVIQNGVEHITEKGKETIDDGHIKNDREG